MLLEEPVITMELDDLVAYESGRENDQNHITIICGDQSDGPMSYNRPLYKVGPNDLDESSIWGIILRLLPCSGSKWSIFNPECSPNCLDSGLFTQ